jgi:transcriptional regulator with XRE-family HTH domain
MSKRFERRIFLEIGKKVKQIRESKKMSVRELSKRLGMDHSYLSRMENGNRPIKTELLIKIAQILDTPIEDFFDGEEKRNINIENEEVIVIDRRALDIEDFTEEQIKEWIRKGKKAYEEERLKKRLKKD